MSKKQTGAFDNTGWGIAILSLIFILAFIIVMLNQEKRIDTIIEHPASEKSVLVCNIGSYDGAFFTLDGASKVNHTVKARFDGDDLYELFYMYEGKMRDSQLAESNSTAIHIKFDKLLGNSSYAASKEIEGNFSYVDNTVRADVLADVQAINSDTAILFLLDSDKLNTLLKMNEEKLKQYYIKEGFSCTSGK